VLLVAVEQRHVGEREALAVDAGLAELELPRRREDLLVVALAAADDGREQRDRVAGEVFPEPLQDLAAALHADGLVAGRAVLHAELREEAEVVRDLGHRRHGRCPATAREPLLDRDRRRQSLQHVDVGLRHDGQELARVRRQAVDVAALPLGVEHVEGERRLAGSGEAGEDDELVARDLERDVAQVVLAGADDADHVARRGRRPRRLPVADGERAFERLAEIWRRAGARRRRHDLRRAGRDQAPAGLAAVGPEVDHPVGALHDLEVVLDHDERVPAVDEPREAGEQLLDVGQVEAGRRLVEDEERVRLALVAQMGGELDPLRLAAGERRERCPTRR
jgi:hypothetical protein